MQEKHGDETDQPSISCSLKVKGHGKESEEGKARLCEKFGIHRSCQGHLVAE